MAPFPFSELFSAHSRVRASRTYRAIFIVISFIVFVFIFVVFIFVVTVLSFRRIGIWVLVIGILGVIHLSVRASSRLFPFKRDS